MSYCKCGGYLGSGGVDGYADRWCKCANPIVNNSTNITNSEFILPTYSDYKECDHDEEHIDNLEKENAQLKADNEQLTYYKTQWQKIGGKANLENLVNKVEKLKNALEFYGDESNWSKEYLRQGKIGRQVKNELHEDGGKKARQVLKELEDEK